MVWDVSRRKFSVLRFLSHTRPAKNASFSSYWSFSVSSDFYIDSEIHGIFLKYGSFWKKNFYHVSSRKFSVLQFSSHTWPMKSANFSSYWSFYVSPDFNFDSNRYMHFLIVSLISYRQFSLFVDFSFNYKNLFLHFSQTLIRKTYFCIFF